MQRRRQTYWLTDALSPSDKSKARTLEGNGHRLEFYHSIVAFNSALERQRVAFVVVSNYQITERGTLQLLRQLATRRELQGARMMLIDHLGSSKVAMLAAVLNFRDVIGADADDQTFLDRVRFATASRPLRYEQPSPQLTLHSAAQLTMPVRLTWLGDQTLRIETSVRPHIGASLHLHGALAELLGATQIKLRVTRRETDRLMYRFSEAVIAEWTAPTDLSKADIAERLASVKAVNPGPKCRVFMALKDSKLRSAAMTAFDDPRFEVAAALQKQAIINEPKFFSPSIIIVEHELAFEDGGSRLQSLLDQLHEDVTVIILGRSSHPTITLATKGHRIDYYGYMPQGLPVKLLKRHRPDLQALEKNEAGDLTYLSPDEDLSFGSVSFEARLTRLHPKAAQIASPFAINSFALASLKGPALAKVTSRGLMLKCTEVWENTRLARAPYVYMAECYLADVTSAEQGQISELMKQVVDHQLSSYLRVAANGATDQDLVTEPRETDSMPPRIETRVTYSGLVEAEPLHAKIAARQASTSKPIEDQQLYKESTSNPLPTASTAANRHLEHQPKRQVSTLDAVAVADEVDGGSGERIIDGVTIKRPGEGGKSPGAKSNSYQRWHPPTFRLDIGDYRQLIVGAAFVGFASALLWAFLTLLAPRWNQADGIFSNKMRSFAPQLWQKQSGSDDSALPKKKKSGPLRGRL